MERAGILKGKLHWMKRWVWCNEKQVKEIRKEMKTQGKEGMGRRAAGLQEKEGWSSKDSICERIENINIWELRKEEF